MTSVREVPDTVWAEGRTAALPWKRASAGSGLPSAVPSPALVTPFISSWVAVPTLCA